MRRALIVMIKLITIYCEPDKLGESAGNRGWRIEREGN